MISPDTTACEHNSYSISLAVWWMLRPIERHLYMCTIVLHRAVQHTQQLELSHWWKPSDARSKVMPRDVALFHHHQASAVQELRRQLDNPTSGPNPSIFISVIMLLSSQIQQSAYGLWHAHLDGARTLLNMWGLKSMVGVCDYGYFVFLTTDIFGMATAPKKYISQAPIEHHVCHIEVIGQLDISTCSSLTPVPNELLIAINILRAHSASLSQVLRLKACGVDLTFAGITSYIQTFDPAKWAATVCRHPLQSDTLDIVAHNRRLSDIVPGLTLLAQCFQNAALLYLMFNKPFSESRPSCEDDIVIEKSLAYSMLITAVHNLFDRRNHGGIQHKFIL